MQVSWYFLWCPENGKNYGKKALFDIFTFEIIYQTALTKVKFSVWHMRKTFTIDHLKYKKEIAGS